MFDDLNPQNKGGQGAVEDIFSSADPVKDRSVAKPPVFAPKPAPLLTSAVPGEAPVIPEHRDSGKKYFVLGLLILVLASLVYGGFWTYSKYGKPYLAAKRAPVIEETAAPAEQPADETPENVPAAQPAASTEDPAPVAPADLPAPVAVDSDQDGLSDEEESAYKTDPYNTDTDGDGLFDREEVKVYKTDPLNKDTDGDTYSDGAEVKGGYNPNGPGKLYEVK